MEYFIIKKETLKEIKQLNQQSNTRLQPTAYQDFFIVPTSILNEQAYKIFFELLSACEKIELSDIEVNQQQLPQSVQALVTQLSIINESIDELQIVKESLQKKLQELTEVLQMKVEILDKIAIAQQNKDALTSSIDDLQKQIDELENQIKNKKVKQ